MASTKFLFVLLQALVLVQGRSPRPPPFFRPHSRPLPSHGSSGVPAVANECGDNSLVCVEEDDCSEQIGTTAKVDGHRCPPFFVYDNLMKYCVNVKIAVKDQLDAVEICESQGAQLFYFQNSAEFKELVKAMNAQTPTVMVQGTTYWIDAYYDDKREVWIRRTTEEEIHWEQIFTDLGTKPLTTRRNIEILRSVDTNKRCLTVKYDAAHPERLKVKPEKCTDAGDHNVVCKLGVYDNNCQKRRDQVCCYSPSSDFYLKNQRLGPGSELSAADANCFIQITSGTRLRIVTCDAAIRMLADADPTTGNKALNIPFRVESSFFYFSLNPCKGKNERKAVISSPKVHEFISRYLAMANLETANTYTEAIFGLEYRGGVHKMVWQNGRPVDYYEDTYWNGNRPPFNTLGDSSSPVCGVYKISPVPFEYRWELSSTCTAAGKVINVCEMPIRITNLMPTSEKVDCGMRHRRGVLARSAYATGHELQALYGEFPWHVAIYKIRHHGGLVSSFSCSGVLIGNQFVVTAAHCVVGASKSFSVVLGEYKVGGASSVLEREVLSVDDILIYPGYETTNPLAHDIALLQLSTEIKMENYPQIGVACLPFPDILYRNTGAWDCMTVGWNGNAGALQKVESNILPNKYCRLHTRPYYDYIGHVVDNKYGLGSGAYDKAHGHHLVTYNQHSYFNRRFPDLICTAPHESEACVDDSSAILVCRRAPVHTDDIFGSGNRGYVHQGYQKPAAWIVNAYGKYRFDSDRWYVMGVSHSLSSCGTQDKSFSYYRPQTKLPKQKVQVFTPIHEYLSFIHAHQDARITA